MQPLRATRMRTGASAASGPPGGIRRPPRTQGGRRERSEDGELPVPLLSGFPAPSPTPIQGGQRQDVQIQHAQLNLNLRKIVRPFFNKSLSVFRAIVGTHLC